MIGVLIKDMIFGIVLFIGIVVGLYYFSFIFSFAFKLVGYEDGVQYLKTKRHNLTSKIKTFFLKDL